MDTDKVRALVDDTLPGAPAGWPTGWPGEIEAALLDAVFSARATYGGPATGVRRVIGRWREHRGDALNSVSTLDSLPALAAFTDDPEALAEILGNRQRVPGNYTTKAEAVALAARVLASAGVTSASDIGDGRVAWDAVTSVPGLGALTWETFVLQLGLLGPRALATMSGFVSDAVGSPVSDDDALQVLAAVSETLGVESSALLGAVWRHGR
ncbi:hypothetical protein [Prescottella subtropica]|uniref:hypothetical protein n=1 Tax=Prescottella subtropica TaxID=2545757 RepID=UPI0010F4801A|nr:hypothetical protein [Prescottella subtropica]